MTTPGSRIGLEFAAALAAAALGWSAASSWAGLVAEPSQYLGPALVAALLIGLVGATGRVLRLRWYATLGIQLVTILVWFQHATSDSGLAGWIPTPEGLADLFREVRDGSSVINSLAAPVEDRYTEASVYLIACSLLILILIDLIACGLRLPAWAGVPALVAITIPISILDGGLPLPAYLATGFAFALLLGVLEVDRVAGWGPPVGEPGRRPRSTRVALGTLGLPGLLIATTATTTALVVSLGVPIGNGLFGQGDDAGPGSGRSGGSGRVTLTNPLVDLRRDLVRRDRLPLLDVRTDAKDVSYLRLTILDAFASDSWTPSPRDLRIENRVGGQLPNPVGLNTSNVRDQTTWQMSTTPDFLTTWLATPTFTRSVTVDEGDWRTDPRFLDIASADNPPPAGISYELTSTSPIYDGDVLAAAPPPPADLVRDMTTLPTLPPVVEQTARRITATGTTNYAKAVLLQDWFRTTGGFTYSLARAAGDGLEQLARFITTDKIGYCEQFAAAMAVMARSLGLPTRVVVGFLSPSDQDSAGGFRFTSDDLHAWPEVFFSGAGWVRFEPTPSARTGASPPWTQGQASAPEPTTAPTAPTARPTTAPQTPIDPTTVPTPGESAKSQRVPTYAIAASAVAFLLMLALIPTLLRGRQRRVRMRPRNDGAASIEALWSELRAISIDFGAPWPDGRTPRMTFERLRSWVPPGDIAGTTDEDVAALQAMVALVEQARYRYQFELTDADHRRAVGTVHRWAALVRARAGERRAWRARVFPPSLMPRHRDTETHGGGEDSDELASTN